jgi:hypothetical protein
MRPECGTPKTIYPVAQDELKWQHMMPKQQRQDPKRKIYYYYY